MDRKADRKAQEEEVVVKIRFKEDISCTLVHVNGDEMDETFEAGSEQEGELLYDVAQQSVPFSDQNKMNGDEYISFGDPEGWQMHGLKKSQFEVVNEG